jgi:hypothetical protein
MRPVRLLVILLITATLLVDLVVVSVVAPQQIGPADWPHPALVVPFSLCVAQVSLLAIWTGFAGKSLPWRLLGHLLVVGLWSRLVAWTIDRPDHVAVATDWTCLLVAQSAVILLPLWAARLRGVRLVRASNARLSNPAAPGRGRFQFSLGYLLSWTTALAVVLGLAQYTLQFEELMRILVSAWWVLPVLAVSHGGLALAGLWAVLGTARPWVRCLVAVLTIAATVVANHLWTGMASYLWPYAALCVLQLLWVVASLSVFRVAGYRMTRVSRAGVQQLPASPDAG